ncbi:serine protease 55 [Pogona vitticeps]
MMNSAFPLLTDLTTFPPVPIFSCGLSSKFKATSWILPKAEGGKTQDESEVLPWQVSIQADGKHVCGGAILSSWWILSAAHCFQEDISSRLHVVVHMEGNPSGIRDLERVIVHQDFNGETLQNDIALILLDSPIHFSEETTPICLPLLHDLSIWHNCWVATWRPTPAGPGADENGTTKVLKRTEMTVIGREACAEKVPGLKGDVMCSISEEEGPKICRDDSGSPLVCTHGKNTKWFMVAVARKGEHCEREGSPAIYTVVFHYIDWIEKATAIEGKPFIPEGVDDIGVRTEPLTPRSASPSPACSAAAVIPPILALTVFRL